MPDDYEFTKDWFSWSPPIWEQVFKQLKTENILEIGCFEGRATTWLIENVDCKKIVCIDTFEGGEEHTPEIMEGVYERWKKNIDIALDRTAFNPDVQVQQCDSYNGLIASWRAFAEFDFIYIDGSHVAKDVLTDACLAWPMLKMGGVLCFDDYGWGEPIPETHKPKLAIDAFTHIFQEDLDVIHKGYQLIVQKVN
jgi:predicted O-methyltransferase YrrM